MSASAGGSYRHRYVAAVLLVVSALASAPRARGEFSLVMKTSPAAGRRADMSVSLALPETGSLSPTDQRKHPWRAALETFSINVFVWSIDRYIVNDSFAHIGWSTWKRNLKMGFHLDNDVFLTNLFDHPYHGGLYFNAARSQGMSFWQSTPYVLGGSLMWELFMENSLPSTDDLIYTTVGGIYLGEFFYRMSSQALDDSATGARRFWHEVLGFVLDPVRGFNRIISGDSRRVLPANGEVHEILTGDISFGGVVFDELPDLPHSQVSAGVGLDFQYGDWCRCAKAYRPFDLIAFDGQIRDGKRLYFQLDTYAPLFAKQKENARGQRFLYGLFQDYDYIKNEGLELGGVALTGGALATLPLSAKSTFQGSVQAGGVVWGGSNNIYTHVEDRDYNYEMGPVLKLESSVSVKDLGRLRLRASHFQLFSVGGAPTVADRTHDLLTMLEAQADVHLAGKTGLRFGYTAFFRHTHFNGHPEYIHTYYQLQGALVLGF